MHPVQPRLLQPIFELLILQISCHQKRGGGKSEALQQKDESDSQTQTVQLHETVNSASGSEET